ncbi:MAG: putative toxin-antitoxin system toxin component, PIN family [Nanoarchaeota archaeon]|nr:putative toxin-antitoxin system toxin component, PIN family [Nanoarchaeota archaeon]
MKAEDKKLIKAVLDTNVLISSILWKKGNPYNIVQLTLDNKFKSFTSNEILNELIRILRDKFEQPEEMIQRQVALVLKYSSVVNPIIKFREIKDDPKDDMILECACEAKVNYICSGDKHLLNLVEFKKIKMLTPKDFLNKILS